MKNWYTFNFLTPNCDPVQYQLWIKHLSYNDKRGNHQLKKFLIVMQILLVNILENI